MLLIPLNSSIVKKNKQKTLKKTPNERNSKALGTVVNTKWCGVSLVFNVLCLMLMNTF